MVPCKSTAEEVSFEWSHHRISSADLKATTALRVSITDSENESVNRFFRLFILRILTGSDGIFQFIQLRCIFVGI